MVLIFHFSGMTVKLIFSKRGIGRANGAARAAGRPRPFRP
ncbi:hypothetical protein AX27061_3870 [Achromobacter xylosoxidans NBRC 15126 = ATCC 27061]|nr:hypothetical protein AX27061_3870 [Achromobacter xylosoxidans NBRC 15126 = ATCC 27061]